MRLRALRVTVDVRPRHRRAVIPDAAACLRGRGADGRGDRAGGGRLLRGTPGQAITYQVGKTQIFALLADAARAAGGSRLQALHDRLWLNGNVPIALQRWELLDDRADLDRIDAAHGLRCRPNHSSRISSRCSRCTGLPLRVSSWLSPGKRISSTSRSSSFSAMNSCSAWPIVQRRSSSECTIASGAVMCPTRRSGEACQ